MKRQATDWETIFSNNIFDQKFISRIQKELPKFNNKIKNNLIFKMSKKEENIGRTLYDINHSKILFDPSPREMEIKTK